MKKQTLLFLAISLIISLGVKADPGTVTVTIDNVIEQPGTVSIPVYFDIDVDTPGVGSIELLIEFESGVLTDFDSFTNVASDIEGNSWDGLTGVIQDPQDPGKLKINTTAGDEDDYLTSFSGVLFEMQFEYDGGQSDITFEGQNAEGESEIGGEDGDQIPANFVNGSINQEQPPAIPITLWSILIGFGLISLFTLKRAAKKQ